MAVPPNGRVQAPDIADAGPLRVPGAVISPSQGAPSVPHDNRLSDLAQSLGSFSSSLGPLSHSLAMYASRDKIHQAEELAKLKAINTPDAFRDKVLAGEIPAFADPHVQMKADVTFGQYTAQSLQKDYQEKLASGELRPEDAPAWLLQHRDQTLRDPTFAGNDGRQTGYGSAWNNLYADAQHKQMGAQVAVLADNRNVAVGQRTEMIMDDLFGKVPPQQAWNHVNANKKALVEDFHLTPKQADEYIWRDLARRVEKDPNWVVEFATAQRKDVSGNGVIPAIGDHPDRADQLSSWRKTQERFNTAAAKQQVESTIAAADLNALLAGDGSFHNITDKVYTNPVSGGQDTLTRENRQNEAVTAFNTQSARAAIHETPAQTFEREAQVFIDNNVKNPTWKSQIEDGVNLANPRSLTNPAAVQQLGGAYHKFLGIEGRSPAYVKLHISDSARTYYSTAKVLQDSVRNPDGSRMTDVQALVAARGAEDADTPAKQEQLRPIIDGVRTKVGELANPHSTIATLFNGRFGIDTANAANKADVAHDIEKLATALVRTGRLDGEHAVEAAVEHLSKTGKVIGGMWVRNSSDSNFDYGAVSSRVITDFVKSPEGKAMGYHPGDVKLWDQGDGRYALVNSMNLPVYGGRTMLSSQDMAEVQRKINAEKNAETLRVQGIAAETQKERSKDAKFSDLIPSAVSAITGPANDAAYEALMSGGGMVDKDSELGRAIIKEHKRRHNIKD